MRESEGDGRAVFIDDMTDEEIVEFQKNERGWGKLWEKVKKL